MSDFPKRSAAFNPNAYRSQAAYNAHKASLRNDTDLPKKQPADFPKPTGPSNPNGYRNQSSFAAQKSTLRSDVDHPEKRSPDIPKPDAFNPQAYRSQAAFDAHKNTLLSDAGLPMKQPSNMPKANTTFNRQAYRSQAAHNSNKNIARGSTHPPKQQSSKQQSSKKQYQKPQFHKAQTKRSSKPAEGSSTQTSADEPHFMSDAEVKEWFRQAELDYERKKAAGHYDNYVPAGGHTPDFSAFRAKFSASKADVPGLKNSMHAPLKASEHAKPQGGK